MNRKAALIVCGLLGVAASSAVAVSAAQPDRSSDGGRALARQRASHPAPAAHARALRVLRRESRYVRALRKARTSADAIPAAVSETPLVSDGVVDLSLATRPGGADDWIVPTTNGRSLCVLRPGSLACADVNEVNERGLSVTTAWNADSVSVTAIARDGVKQIAVVGQDGRQQQVPVSNNLFTLDARRMPRELRWDGPAGPAVYRLPVLLGR